MGKQEEYETYKPLTLEQKKELEGKYKRFKEIEVPIGDEDELDCEYATFVIVAPTRELLYIISKYEKQNNLKKANEVIMKNCIKYGDMEYLEDDSS